MDRDQDRKNPESGTRRGSGAAAQAANGGQSALNGAPGKSSRSARRYPAAAVGVGTGNGQLSVQAKSSTGSAAVETDGHKEMSWARPVTDAGGSLTRVGAIFFRTKEYVPDSNDLGVLQQLAEWYSESDGLRGQVRGYADPRRSSQPNNQELSELRATWVTNSLREALVARGCAAALGLAIVPMGMGVEGTAPAESAVLAEGNLLAPHRRADVYLAGSPRTGMAPKKDKQKVPEPGQQPPNLKGWPHGFDDRIGLVEQGNQSIINGIAIHVYGDLEGIGGDQMMTLRMIGITPKEPPWWNGRASGLHRSQGRSGKRNQLVGDALLLVRDYKELAFLYEKYMGGSGSELGKYVSALRSRSASPAEVEEAALPLRHLLFIMEETKALARKVYEETQ